MHITARCYVLSGIIVLLGIYGQWASNLSDDVWKIPLALILLALLLEAFHIGKRPVSIERQLPKTGFLGQRFTGHLAVYNPSSEPLFLLSQPSIPTNSKAPTRCRNHSLTVLCYCWKPIIPKPISKNKF